MCTVTPSENQTAVWVIDNGRIHTVQQLHNGILAGYSSDGNNLVIENIMMNDDRNGTKYACATVLRNTNRPTIVNLVNESNQTVLYVIGKYTAESCT